jgi:hypothetical protein
MLVRYDSAFNVISTAKLKAPMSVVGANMMGTRAWGAVDAGTIRLIEYEWR